MNGRKEEKEGRRRSKIISHTLPLRTQAAAAVVTENRTHKEHFAERIERLSSREESGQRITLTASCAFSGNSGSYREKKILTKGQILVRCKSIRRIGKECKDSELLQHTQTNTYPDVRLTGRKRQPDQTDPIDGNDLIANVKMTTPGRR